MKHFSSVPMLCTISCWGHPLLLFPHCPIFLEPTKHVSELFPPFCHWFSLVEHLSSLFCPKSSQSICHAGPWLLLCSFLWIFVSPKRNTPSPPFVGSLPGFTFAPFFGFSDLTYDQSPGAFFFFFFKWQNLFLRSNFYDFSNATQVKVHTQKYKHIQKSPRFVSVL